MSDDQLRHQEAILRHYLVVFMIYSFLEGQRFNRYQELLALDPLAEKPTLGDIKHEYDRLARRLLIQSIFSLCQQGLDLPAIYKIFAV